MKVKGLLFNHKTREVTKVEVDNYMDYVSLIGCEYFDVVTRVVGGNRVSFYVDDIGLYKADYKVTAIAKDFGEKIVGSVVIVGPADSEGYSTDLSDEAADCIIESIRHTGVIVYEY